MKLSGSYKLNSKKETVWNALNDPNILKQCIPGCDSFKKNSANSFEATATNQIGPMNATFTGKITLSNIKVNKSYTLSGEGQSSVGFVNGSANVEIDEIDGVTTLNYNVNVNVGGKVAQLGSRLINGVAKKMSSYFFGRFADLVSPLSRKSEIEKKQEIEKSDSNKITVDEKRVKELKSNFLNKYIYSAIVFFILLLVAILYFLFKN